MTAFPKYDPVAMSLHWLIAVLMIPLLFLGEEMMEAEDGLAAAGLPSLHVSLGLTILALSLLRLGWRLVSPPPPLPRGMAGWETALSRLNHGLFYVLMIGLPVTGWLILGAYAQDEHIGAVSLFGLLTVPPGPHGGDIAEAFHKVGSKVGIGLLALHVLAALKHQFMTRDNLIGRILPG